jgi:hypothetical protein
VVSAASPWEVKSVNGRESGSSRQGGLSERGSVAAVSEVRPDQELYFQALQDRYHISDNPDGSLLMNVAENKLGWPVLKAKIETICREGTLPDWTASYTEPQGAPEVRQAVVDFHGGASDEVPDGPGLLGADGWRILGDRSCVVSARRRW